MSHIQVCQAGAGCSSWNSIPGRLDVGEKSVASHPQSLPNPSFIPWAGFPDLSGGCLCWLQWQMDPAPRETGPPALLCGFWSSSVLQGLSQGLFVGLWAAHSCRVTLPCRVSLSYRWLLDLLGAVGFFCSRLCRRSWQGLLVSLHFCRVPLEPGIRSCAWVGSAAPELL